MKRLVISLLISWPLWFGVVHGQVPTQVWSCNTNCNVAGNTYADGGWRGADPRPVYVAATNGTNTACTRNWWNTNGAVRWRRPVDLQPTHCVAILTGNVESFVPASTFGWPNTTPPPPPPPPVDCVVGEWGEWTAGEWGQCRNRTQSRVETRSRTNTPPQNGGAACPTVNTETRDVSQACSLSPPCWPHKADVLAGRVRFAALETPHPKYGLKATYFCASGTIPTQHTWATSWGEIFARAVVEQDGSYSEEAAADQCEAECEVVTGALKEELDAFAALFTAEMIGTIE